MGFMKGEVMVAQYEYDFEKQGGAVGVIELTPIHRFADDSLFFENAVVKIETTLASTGTPTVTVGYTGDNDAYVANFWASRTAGQVSVGAGAGVAKAFPAAPAKVLMEIGTAPLSAGKVQVVFECVRPV